MWGKDPERLLRGMLTDGFEIIIVAVAAPPLDKSWLGRRIDEKCIAELAGLNKKYGISLVGEGGEFETFVLSCPLFRKRIKILESEKHWDEKARSGYLDIRKIETVDK